MATNTTLRKVSFFFPVSVQNKSGDDKQLVRSFAIGTQVRDDVIIDIEEKLDSNTEEISFDIWVGKKPNLHKWLWKSYTPMVSDIEREYEQTNGK